jgi:hypothetical protein
LLLPLNEAARLASTDEIVVGSLFRRVVTIVVIIGKGRGFKAL